MIRLLSGNIALQPERSMHNRPRFLSLEVWGFGVGAEALGLGLRVRAQGWARGKTAMEDSHVCRGATMEDEKEDWRCVEPEGGLMQM